ncbi:MAG: TlyA family RNA methyltransferase [Campylobacterales bacterium]|nr:TlyA family RNA methyltransferase [Campylobacterales bacterium]
MRLDKYLVEKGYFESRNRATSAIEEGRVMIDGKCAKASTKVHENSIIEVQKSKFYVSRAAQKLEGFLEEHPIKLEGRVALDIGSSTGGFAQILLEKGVAQHDCVDVGSDQLHHSLRDNPKLSLFEATDIRDFKSQKSYDVVTCDVSFISILQIIEDINRLAHQDIIILYKPQFEVGREAKRDKRGVVTDKNAIEKVQEEFLKVTQTLKWKLITSLPSSLAGKDGNVEYLYHFRIG